MPKYKAYVSKTHRDTEEFEADTLYLAHNDMAQLNYDLNKYLPPEGGLWQTDRIEDEEGNILWEAGEDICTECENGVYEEGGYCTNCGANERTKPIGEIE